jgi:hypothetical protein
MTLRYSTALRTDQAAAINTLLGTSAKLAIYTGSQPGSVADAATGTKLAELTCNSGAFGDASLGALTLRAITSATITATGTAGWFRISTSGSPGTAHIDGAVTATGGGGELTLSSTSLVSGASISISSAVITIANS